MKYIFISCVIIVCFACCTKDTESPVNNSNGNNINVIPKPQTVITVAINDVPMQITSSDFGRGTSSLFIEEKNALQKVRLEVNNFSQTSAASYICPFEVAYYTRSDSTSEWYKTTISNRDQDLYFDNFAPLEDNIVTGYFGVSSIINKSSFKIHCDFKLVFK